MAAKKPSAKPAKAKQTVVKKAPALKEPAKDTAKKAASAKKASTVASRPKPVAAAPRTTSASTHASNKADKPIEPIKPVAIHAPKAATAATAAQGVGMATHKPAPKVTNTAAPVEQTDDIEESISEPAPATPVKPTNSARPVISHLNPHSQDTDASNDSEDSDGQDLASLNLLAGPRNVKPYIPRRGEQYMNKEQLDHFRQILSNWKRDLMQEVDRTVLHMKDEAANFPDPNDRATQESEFSLELRTRDRERKLIRKIEEAIKRIEDGSYGYCVETGEEIGIKRLEARPVATLCIEAQERRERRELQYGDRDDRYR